jgi:poly-gamma-glutamate system protein
MRERAIFVRVFVALLALFLGIVSSALLSREEANPLEEIMRRAAFRMARAEDTVAAKRQVQGIAINPTLDPYHTGLIGDESSIITTTLGDIVAKRTTTNTAFAALMVRFFHELNLKPGDRIAVGSSGSFPGALFAILAACAELEIEPIVITSIGASEYGANIERLSNAEMMIAVRDAGVWPYMPAAISPGGDGDRCGSSFYALEPTDELARYARQIALNFNIPFIGGLPYEASFEEHLDVYKQAGPIKAFVNIGGADINFGSDSASLSLKPGIVRPRLHTRGARYGGLLGYYLDAGVPVLHLLNIKSLALQAGIPLDADPRAPLPASLLTDKKAPLWPVALGLIFAAAALAFRRLPR